ncbi:MBOAT family protein [Campylobacter sp. RM9332]|uniref:MBOAT family O-acyltransferase n=1 Tax=Campylobacter sp. RM9332 TaxID=2735730 RepID=UPI003015479A|nr:MBOAT family protein [Campylobacter sp. RM9332]
MLGFINFSLFVSFFPQLIAGPIVHYKDMMPQFKNPNNFILRYKNIALGLLFFTIGLFKKVALADYLAPSVDSAYAFVESGGVLNLIESWVLTHAYTFELYFDFSGYSDMAIGLALFFNIKLLYNFNSPYKSLSISEFWQRWHMTLGKFLKDYIYIPLGGSRVGKSRQYINLFIVFLISGIWHGAGWGFIIWGSLHGIAICIHKVYMSVFANVTWFKNRLNSKFYKVIMWIITFEFINITWVFFRATSINDALSVIKSMFLIHGQIVLSPNMQRLFQDNPLFAFGKWGEHFTIGQSAMLNAVLLMIAFVLLFRSSHLNIYKKFIFKDRYFILIGIMLIWCILKLNITAYTKFIYFNF